MLDAAFAVHKALGPGLLESVYENCLTEELRLRDVASTQQVGVPVVYGAIRLEVGFRIDLLVAGCVVVEVKSVDGLLPVHTSQVLTYLRFSERRLGFLINFNVPLLRQGIRRIVL